MAGDDRAQDSAAQRGDPAGVARAPGDLEPGSRDPSESENVDSTDKFDDDPEGGVRGGAVGGEKGAVAATAAGETVRNSIPDGAAEPNSPEAMQGGEKA